MKRILTYDNMVKSFAASEDVRTGARTYWKAMCRDKQTCPRLCYATLNLSINPAICGFKNQL